MDADWTPNPDAVIADLGHIAQEQAHLPACTLCGQRTIAPDTFGLCSKVDAAHQAKRVRS